MSKGRFGVHGGQYIPETLMNEIQKLEEAYEFYKKDEQFNKELDTLLKEYAGRPSLLYYAEKMTRDLGGAKIYFKREDLNHTGSHKINNVLVRGVRMHRLYLSVVNWGNISFRKAGTTGERKKRRKPYFMPNTIVMAREPIRKPAQLSLVN